MPIKTTFTLITGGSSGIGLAFVNELADKGYNICIISNQKEKLAAIEIEIEQKYKVECKSLFIDLAEDNAAQEVYNYCKKQELTIEILINNAGFLIADNFMNVPPQNIIALLKLHIITTTLLCQFFAEDMIAQGKGFILNVSSTTAHMPYPLISVYGPSKTYLRNFTRALHNELYTKNINVSCILPGAVATELYDLSPSKENLA